jgi:hypothetical protein
MNLKTLTPENKLTVNPFASFPLPVGSNEDGSLRTASGINLLVFAAKAIPIFFSFMAEDLVPKTLVALRKFKSVKISNQNKT